MRLFLIATLLLVLQPWAHGQTRIRDLPITTNLTATARIPVDDPATGLRSVSPQVLAALIAPLIDTNSVTQQQFNSFSNNLAAMVLAIINGGYNYRLVGSQYQLLSDTGLWWLPVGISNPESLGLAVPTDQTAVANVRRRDGMMEFLFDDGLWRAPFVSGDDLTPELSWALPDATPFANERFVGGNWQLLNPSTGHFHVWFVSDQSIAFGPAQQ